MTAFGITYGVLQLVNGPLGDRLGKLRLIFWVTVISALGNLACALAPSLATLVLARALTGATVGAIVPTAMAWIGDVVPYEGRQSVLAKFLVGHMAGIALSTVAAGGLGELFGWRAIFYVLTVLYVVTAVLLWQELRRHPAAAPGPGAQEPLPLAFVRMLALTKRPWVRAILLGVAVEGFTFYAGVAFVAYHLHVSLDLSLTASGAVVSLFAVGGMAYAAVSGRLIRRLGEPGLVLWGGSALVLGFGLLVAANTVALAILATLSLGIGFYMLHNTFQVNATQMAPEARGAALAIFAFSLFCGQAAGVWVGSKIVDHYGARPIFVGCAVGLAVLTWAFRRTLLARRARA